MAIFLQLKEVYAGEKCLCILLTGYPALFLYSIVEVFTFEIIYLILNGLYIYSRYSRKYLQFIAITARDLVYVASCRCGHV